MIDRTPPQARAGRAGRAAVTATVFLVVAGLLLYAYLRRERNVGVGVYETLPNIVLVTVDTLRADHLSCYGYFRPTSPTLDALAAEGLLIERAMATSGTTLPSHLSLLTGLYPHQHGYLSNGDALKAPFRSSEGRSSVARHLQKAGYYTTAFVSGPTVGTATGIQDGFDHFDEHDARKARSFEDRSRIAKATTDLVLEWLAGPDAREPFFLWVHYWDPHEPNMPHEPHASMFQADENVERLLDERRVRPELFAKKFEPIELSRIFAPELTPRYWAKEDIPHPPIDRQSMRDLIDRYDGDVRAVDDQLGRLVNELRRSGVWDETIFAFTSDHGQSLGQHDWLEHGQVQQDNVHVPLVLRLPGDLVRQPRRIPGPVSLIDIMPTIVARIPSSEARDFLLHAEGQDFLSGAFDRPYAFAMRSAREREEWEPGLVFALRTAEWTYYHYTESTDRLYRIEQDPLEQNNVAADHPEVVEALRKHVEGLLKRRPYTVKASADGVAPNPELAETLKSLGYIGDDPVGAGTEKRTEPAQSGERPK